MERRPRFWIVQFLLLLVSSFSSMQFISSTKTESVQPYEIYFFKGYERTDEEFMAVWQTVQDTYPIKELATYGNFSVLILFHVYSTGGDVFGEWWVTATSLQPDEFGTVHQVVFLVPKPGYIWTMSPSTRYFNPVNITEAASIIKDFIDDDPHQYGVGFDESCLYSMGPFAIYFEKPMDFGITIVFNMKTGRLMIAATGVWMGHGQLLFIAFGDAVVDIVRDGKCDCKDLAVLAVVYGSQEGGNCYDSHCDLNKDGRVDCLDLFKLADDYGKITQPW